MVNLLKMVFHGLTWQKQQITVNKACVKCKSTHFVIFDYDPETKITYIYTL